MSIRLFADKNCKGDSRVVVSDLRDPKGLTADKPSSLVIEDEDKAVLLFKNDDCHGGALYIRGPATVNALGSGDDGGRTGFGNSIRSVRVTPFQVDLNVTVVTDSKGNLPGDWKTQPEAKDDIRKMVDDANAFLDDKRALLQLGIARITLRSSDYLFAISKLEQIVLPGEWTEKGEVDVVFTHRFTKEGTLGRGFFPCWGESVAVAKRLNSVVGADTSLTLDAMAITMMHEIGHHFGLGHGTANTDKNLMFASLEQDSLSKMWLSPDQIREMHDRLANNISRRAERKDPRPDIHNPTP
jgi:hypothetical protein